jgi:hypothetical protein
MAKPSHLSLVSTPRHRSPQAHSNVVLQKRRPSRCRRHRRPPLGPPPPVRRLARRFPRARSSTPRTWSVAVFRMPPWTRPRPALLPLRCSMQCPRRPCARTTSCWRHLLPWRRWRSSRASSGRDTGPTGTPFPPCSVRRQNCGTRVVGAGLHGFAVRLGVARECCYFRCAAGDVRQGSDVG